MSKMAEIGKLPYQPSQMGKRQDVVTHETMEESDSSSTAYSEQISELCSQGKYKEAMRIYEEFTHKGVTVNKSTFFHLMDGLIKRRKSISKAARL